MTTSNPRIEVKDAVAGGWFGAREEAQLPARRDGSPLAGSRDADAAEWKWSAAAWLRRVKRAVIDLAVILAAMTAIPVLFVAVYDAVDWRASIMVDDTRAKTASIEPMRTLMVPVDPSITPVDAGTSFAALQPPRGFSAEFPLIPVVYRAMTWQRLKMPPSLFFHGALPFESNAPDIQTVLQAAANGLSTEELDYLRELASAPVWRDFDRIARAKSMDVIGARFVLPFTPNASSRDMPIGSFASTKEIAYAAVSRAAYHLAVGQRDSALTILRSIVSYGFSIADNGTGLIDQLVGRQVVGVGRGALANFYYVTRDPRVADPRVASMQLGDGIDASSMVPIPEHSYSAHSQSIDEMRRELVARAVNPHEIQGIRYASLELLRSSACTNVRDLLFGERADVSDAFRRAKIDLARFPSQQALIDLIQRSLETDPIAGLANASPLRRFLYGTSAIAGAVLHNARLAACTWKVTEGKF